MTFCPPPPPPPQHTQVVRPMTDSELDAFDPNDSAQITREKFLAMCRRTRDAACENKTAIGELREARESTPLTGTRKFKTTKKL